MAISCEQKGGLAKHLESFADEGTSEDSNAIDEANAEEDEGTGQNEDEPIGAGSQSQVGTPVASAASRSQEGDADHETDPAAS